MDVDGILTDGRIILGNNGNEYKAFHSQDGQGIKLLQEKGILPVIITGRKSELVKNRAEELDIKEVYQNIGDKLKIFDKVIKKYELNYSETAFIGDDISDLPLLKKVGLSFTAANGVKKVKDTVDYITKKRGGRGAVREVCDILLSS